MPLVSLCSLKERMFDRYYRMIEHAFFGVVA